MSRVVVDTSVWVRFFNAPHSEEKARVDKLLTDNRVVMVGAILSELLQGSRSRKDYNQIKDKMTAFPYVETSKNTWVQIGETSFRLRKQGITIPLTDILIATLAKENNCEIYTVDPHFERIPEVKLYGS